LSATTQRRTELGIADAEIDEACLIERIDEQIERIWPLGRIERL
jgi:hypothetical protein